MRPEPQAAPYRPEPRIQEIADWIAAPVDAADFPETRLRFRNDRWAQSVGLDRLTDDQWCAHFGRFAPLEANLPRPLALKYHGHQFRTYNPQIGDGRGFLFAQMRDAEGRLLDLGTKGSGQTPYSRDGDGRLTLKGAVREILATEMLEAQGVHTSKTFSVIETGEQLARGDEPSPTRSAVMVRLSHGHIRIGSFQRLAALDERDHLAALVDYALSTYPGPMPPADAPARDEPAVILLHQVVERLADLAASYMVAGFVHGVLNTDNMNISGESFDYGPWRWLPRWEGGFTAAYFDQTGLYCFGRQPEAIHWNCAQLGNALLPLAEKDALVAAIDRFAPLYHSNVARRMCWRLGVASQGEERDLALFRALGEAMRVREAVPEEFFQSLRGLQDVPEELADALADYESVADAPAPAQTMLIEEVEEIWAAIDQRDDWQPLHDKVAALRTYGATLGPAPEPAGHG